MEEGTGLLSGLRILDFTDQKGVYCCKLLANIGAEVIKIEPPGGDPMRNIGPFFRDQAGPERSLYWFHMNTSKKSVTLNLETDAGKDIFRKLAATADVVVETFAPGRLDEMGLGYQALSGLNPELIMASITPFGQTGPWRDYKTSDLVGLAMGGLMSICGWPDKAPERIAGSQAYHQCSMQSALGILIAIYQRVSTGRGMHIDVSMHESIPVTMLASVPNYVAMGEVRKRDGDGHEQPAYGAFACKDGYVDSRLFHANWNDFVVWLDSEGMAGDLKEEKYKDPFFRRQRVNSEHIDSLFRAFLMKHTKKEIYENGQDRGLQIGAINTAKDVSEDRQLAARNYFVDVEHPELGQTLRYLGAPFKLSETPWKICRRAPLIGEDNKDVYEKGLGLSKKELAALKSQGVV
ncbi:MAG: CoA transferase [Chloroflexi bacterium]|nr:CoA transferase [Chloroflexota bacterium]